MCSPQRPNVGRVTEEFGCCTARANDDNSTFLNGRGAGECGFGGKRLRKWHGNHRLNNGGKCSRRNEEERARRRVAGSPPPLLTDLDRSPPAPLFCTSRAKRRFFPSSLSSSSSWNRSHRNKGCSTTVATEEAEASSQIPTTAPQSAHMNEHTEEKFPS